LGEGSIISISPVQTPNKGEGVLALHPETLELGMMVFGAKGISVMPFLANRQTLRGLEQLL